MIVAVSICGMVCNVSIDRICFELEGDQLRQGGEAMNATLVQPNIDRAHAAARSFSSISSLGEQWADVTQVLVRFMYVLLNFVCFLIKAFRLFNL
jgi:hypothetical protein